MISRKAQWRRGTRGDGEWHTPYAFVRIVLHKRISTACRNALRQHGEEKLGPGMSFKFKSRVKHSAYKECNECQEKRLRIRDAIKDGLPPSLIREYQRDYASHLQWMLKQRDCLERLLGMGTNEKMIVEQSDKCGDQCLYIPGNSGRAASSNTSRFQYKIALQARMHPRTSARARSSATRCYPHAISCTSDAAGERLCR